MKMLGQHLRGRKPDAACLALRNPGFREAMMHGIDPECRHVVMMTLVHRAMEIICRGKRVLAELRAERAHRPPRSSVIKSIVLRVTVRVS